ncbi:hypothetical protein [Microvirga makkahensis]|uniref:Uncharacterized protein n=1 Tax=Microvirga makkahensis TaxID=1128670 RepID=A0A7X3MSF9_9HYPH|nr:hypothetical protein [Microvirga makkahensis]MXQ12208.1 hypothetical protein [Microvirga makkahensis]
MLGLKSNPNALTILGQFEMVHMMRKQQENHARNRQLSLSERFQLLAA